MSKQSEGMIIVTGASSGIGLATSQLLLEQGYQVLGIARDFSKLAYSHPQFHQHRLDLAQCDSLAGKMQALLAEISPPIRGLVSCAGVAKVGYLEQLSVADIQLVMNTNFLSNAIVSRALLPRLKTQSQNSDIVFIGSEAALRGSREGSIYCASKFALRGFSQALREECGKSPVRVGLVNPGAVRTNFFDDLHYEPGEGAANAIAAEDVARIVLNIIQTRPGTVWDEVNLSPQSRVWQRKGRK